MVSKTVRVDSKIITLRGRSHTAKREVQDSRTNLERKKAEKMVPGKSERRMANGTREWRGVGQGIAVTAGEFVQIGSTLCFNEKFIMKPNPGKELLAVDGCWRGGGGGGVPQIGCPCSSR